jgi:hypothetical protein
MMEQSATIPRFSPPALMLIAVNVLPLLGVLFAGWSLLAVVALYWLENLVIGAINVLKMATCAPDSDFLVDLGADEHRPGSRAAGGQELSTVGHHLIKLFFIPFFMVHYGMFCMVHGVFVFALLSNDGPFGMRGGPFGGMEEQIASMLRGGMLVVILALVGSHLFSYFYHFLYRGEFRRTNVAYLMAAPYGRIIVLHLAILFGAFATFILGQPIFLLILLIVGKTLLDWQMHLRSHRSSLDETVPWTVPHGSPRPAPRE